MTEVDLTEPSQVHRPRPSTFALKIAMAITGFIFVVFVFVHLIGNLKIFQGAEAFNSYAAWLRDIGYPLIPHSGVLWALRVTLVASLLVHLGAAAALELRGRRARGKHRRRGARTFAAFGAQTMVLTGVVIAVFVIVHVLDLTIGAFLASADFQAPAADGSISAYENLVASFQRPVMGIFYAAAMCAVALHILHGWRTMVQDLGMTGRRLRAIWITVGALIALAVLIGNALIPILVLVGVIA